MEGDIRATKRRNQCQGKFTLPSGGSEIGAANFWGGRVAARVIFQQAVCSLSDVPTKRLAIRLCRQAMGWKVVR